MQELCSTAAGNLDAISSSGWRPVLRVAPVVHHDDTTVLVLGFKLTDTPFVLNKVGWSCFISSYWQHIARGLQWPVLVLGTPLRLLNTPQ